VERLQHLSFKTRDEKGEGRRAQRRGTKKAGQPRPRPRRVKKESLIGAEAEPIVAQASSNSPRPSHRSGRLARSQKPPCLSVIAMPIVTARFGIGEAGADRRRRQGASAPTLRRASRCGAVRAPRRRTWSRASDAIFSWFTVVSAASATTRLPSCTSGERVRPGRKKKIASAITSGKRGVLWGGGGRGFLVLFFCFGWGEGGEGGGEGVLVF